MGWRNVSRPRLTNFVSRDPTPKGRFDLFWPVWGRFGPNLGPILATFTHYEGAGAWILAIVDGDLAYLRGCNLCLVREVIQA